MSATVEDLYLNPQDWYCPEQPYGMYVVDATAGGILVLHGDRAAWVTEAAKKLDSIGRLPRGWNSYGGFPLRDGSRNLAGNVLNWLERENLPVPAVVLASDGVVHFEWGNKGRELEVELQGDAVDYVKVNDQGDVEDEGSIEASPQNLRMLTSWLLRR